MDLFSHIMEIKSPPVFFPLPTILGFSNSENVSPNPIKYTIPYPIVFENGSLFVPRNKTVLQKLLSLYHPHNGKLFLEHKPTQIASNEIDILEMEIEALNAARSLDIDMAEAIKRVEVGSKVRAEQKS